MADPCLTASTWSLYGGSATTSTSSPLPSDVTRLQTTALINEVFLRLVDGHGINWQDRAHFFAVSARLMRRTLVDHARRQHAGKRGGHAITVSFDETAVVSQQRSAELIAIDEALTTTPEAFSVLPRGKRHRAPGSRPGREKIR